MRKILILLALVCALQPTQAQHLLPAPQQVEWGKGTFRMDRPFAVEADKLSTGAAVKQSGWDIAPTATPAETHRRLRYVELKPATNDFRATEGYRLRITPDTIEVAASTWKGFLYAKATIDQLRDKKGNLPCLTISDAPAYRWRGAMIDVSRHFFPLDFLMKQIDVMASYKMNRLHLHLTDAAGWRMEIKRYPRLASFAAWRTDSLWKTWWNDGKRHYVEQGTPGAYGGYYTQEELRRLVAYAEQKGITIIPEIEMPAHSEEVLTAYPELSCTHELYKQADFCPGSVATYDFLENVLREVMDVFPSQYIHVGGDEAGKASWPHCPLCQKKMQEEGIADVNGLQAYLIRHFGKFLKANGRTLIGWDEIIDSTLEATSAVMVWQNVKAAHEAIRLGHDVVLSPGAYCYLDGYQDSPNSQPEAYGGFQPLEKVYSYVPNAGLTADEQKHILGVQGNLWTEHVPTTSHAEYMLYPRLLAIAEIGWNGTSKKDYAEFRERALAACDDLQSRGVRTFDLRTEIGDRPEVLRPIKHKAIGAKVTYHLPYNEKYCGAKEATLTDGKFGGWNYGDGCWQGFIGRRYLDVTVDLGKVQRVNEIGTDFLQCSGPEIFFPAEYKILVSTDGENFQEIKKMERPISKLPLNEIETWSWKGKISTRYIRIQARSAARGGGWVFADEIIVR